ncbi:DnaJ protein,putative [Plasmodium sp. DRC-Itaito]|nr:DnaJ protein,putative [Plasmodium sp. DRC-Itaito]
MELYMLKYQMFCLISVKTIFGNFNNDDISKTSIKSKRYVGSKDSNISKNVGECKFAVRTNKVIESDISSTMMLSLETINTNINGTTLKVFKKKCTKNVERKKMNTCKISQRFHDINESRKRPKKNMSTNSNNISVENEKNNLSESLEKVYTSYRKEPGDEKEHKKEMIMWKKKKKKRTILIKKEEKNVSSPNNRYEYPDTTYYDILNITPDASLNEIKKKAIIN